MGKTYDGDSSTYWRSKSFVDGPEMKPAFKPGVGIVYDLGSQQTVTGASIGLRDPGDHDDHPLWDGLDEFLDVGGFDDEDRDHHDERHQREDHGQQELDQYVLLLDHGDALRVR